MPIYIYEVLRKDKKRGKRFEIKQRITESPLKKHPQTGEPVQRVIVTPPPFLQNRFDKTIKHFAREDKALEVKKQTQKSTASKKIA